MTSQEVFPCVGCPIWHGFHPLFLEDVPHCLAADFLDAYFTEFAHDSRQAKARGFGDEDHEFPDLSGLALSALRILRWRPFTITEPTVEGADTDDGDQFFDGSTKRFAKLDEPFPLGWLGVNLTGDACSKDLVLFLEIFDVLGEFTVGCGRD